MTHGVNVRKILKRYAVNRVITVDEFNKLSRFIVNEWNKLSRSVVHVVNVMNEYN